ncbi:MAG: hypothetical protein COB09_18855 [Thalassobium sp.]|nr:MAG: hypothetical protein COB09_18855 [Thalassobium sp.]
MSKVNIFNKGKRDFTLEDAVVNVDGKVTTPAVVLAAGRTVSVDVKRANSLKKKYKNEIVSPPVDEDSVDNSAEIAKLKAKVKKLEGEAENHKSQVSDLEGKITGLESDLEKATEPTPEPTKNTTK